MSLTDSIKRAKTRRCRTFQQQKEYIYTSEPKPKATEIHRTANQWKKETSSKNEKGNFLLYPVMVS